MNAPVKGHLYIIQSEEGPVKIGISIDPKQRIIAISNTSGRQIVRQFISPPIPAYGTLEDELHRHFKDRRTVGEWFNITFDEAVRSAHLLGGRKYPHHWTVSDAYLRGQIAVKRMRAFSNPSRTKAEWDAFLAGMGEEALEHIAYAEQLDNEMMLQDFAHLQNLTESMMVNDVTLGIQRRVPAAAWDMLHELRKQMDDDLGEAGIDSVSYRLSKS